VIKVTGSRLFLDSSIWLGYFLGNMPETKQLIESEETMLYTSIISIHEIFKKLKRVGKSSKEAMEAIKFIEENSIIIDLNKQAALTAAENCQKYGLHTIDSLIYSSTAETNAIFVTADKDFQQAPKTRVIQAP